MTDRRIIKLPYLRVSQKNADFYLSKASAFDLRTIVDFHFREPYKSYTSYEPKGFEDVKRELEESGASVSHETNDWGVQRYLNRTRVLEIRDYLESDPEALLPTTVLLAIDASQDDDVSQELSSQGVFCVSPSMTVSVIDGQHRLAGIFLAREDVLKQLEIPVVFMLNVSIPVAAKLFQNINGKQQKVNKSVIFDLFDNVPVDSIDNNDDLETKSYHTICVSLYTDADSPLYRQIKMLGVGGGAISQAFFIDACKRELKCLKSKSLQERYDSLFDFFTLVQSLFPEDWPKPIHACSDAEIDAYSNMVLKVRKSQLAKTNGLTAMLRLYNWMEEENISYYAIKCLCGNVDWTSIEGTGAKAQSALFERLKSIIVSRMALN